MTGKWSDSALVSTLEGEKEKENEEKTGRVRKKENHIPTHRPFQTGLSKHVWC